MKWYGWFGSERIEVDGDTKAEATERIENSYGLIPDYVMSRISYEQQQRDLSGMRRRFDEDHP